MSWVEIPLLPPIANWSRLVSVFSSLTTSERDKRPGVSGRRACGNTTDTGCLPARQIHAVPAYRGRIIGIKRTPGPSNINRQGMVSPAAATWSCRGVAVPACLSRRRLRGFDSRQDRQLQHRGAQGYLGWPSSLQEEQQVGSIPTCSTTLVPSSSGQDAALSRQRSRVQIPLGLPTMQVWRNWQTPTFEMRSPSGSTPGTCTKFHTMPGNSPGDDEVCKTSGNANKPTVGSSPTSGTNHQCVSQSGRRRPLEGRGRRFKSSRTDQFNEAVVQR